MPPFLKRSDAGTNLALRVASSLVLAPFVFLCAWLGGLAFLCLTLLVAAILTREWTTLCAAGAPIEGIVLAYVMVIGSTLSAGLLERAHVPYVALIPMSVAAIGLLHKNRSVKWLSGGIAYLSVPLIILLWIRTDPISGQNALLWLLAVVWGTDTGAYLFGRVIGGPKLAPRLSPNKTWAGLIGGMSVAILVGWATAALLQSANILVLSSLGAVLACVAQAGDLFESWVKRSFNAKDSGTLIPGHGGLMDRVDGLLAAALGAAVAFILTDMGADAWL